MNNNIVNLVSIQQYCEEAGISRATFYRKRDEIEIFKVPNSKRSWIVSPEDKHKQIDDSNVLEYLERGNEKMMERLSKVPMV